MNLSLRHTLLAAAAIAAMGVSGAAISKDKLETERDKASYLVGMQIGGSLQQIKDEIDLSRCSGAIETSLRAARPLLSQEEAGAVQQAFAERLQAKHAAEQRAAYQNKQEGEAFLAANRAKPGVKTTASGLQYQVITEGKGDKPAATDTVSVHYTGTLLDGTSSTARWIAASRPVRAERGDSGLDESPAADAGGQQVHPVDSVRAGLRRPRHPGPDRPERDPEVRSRAAGNRQEVSLRRQQHPKRPARERRPFSPNVAATRKVPRCCRAGLAPAARARALDVGVFGRLSRASPALRHRAVVDFP